ncbi:MAG: L,D-transpeptidase [Ignavibacteriaceae bacterium]
MKFILLTFFITISLFAEDDKKSNPGDNRIQSNIDYSNVKDTLYTLSDYFIEVNLSTQMAYLHSRYDSTKTFGVSTGTKKLKDGVETNEGIYAIQFKVKEWYSIQFDSTMMLNFMTFNWGIGFHALAGNSYYKYLGVKKSSHGCVRISRAIANELYQKIKYGTPVIVHKGSPAIEIAFADRNDKKLEYLPYPQLKSAITERLKKLYKGNYLLSYRAKLLIDNDNVTHSGLPVGDGNKINKRQRFKPDYLFVNLAMPEIKGYDFSDSNFLSTINMASVLGNIPEPSSFIDD